MYACMRCAYVGFVRVRLMMLEEIDRMLQRLREYSKAMRVHWVAVDVQRVPLTLLRGCPHA